MISYSHLPFCAPPVQPYLTVNLAYLPFVPFFPFHKLPYGSLLQLACHSGCMWDETLISICPKWICWEPIFTFTTVCILCLMMPGGIWKWSMEMAKSNHLHLPNFLNYSLYTEINRNGQLCTTVLLISGHKCYSQKKMSWCKCSHRSQNVKWKQQAYSYNFYSYKFHLNML